MRLELFTDDIDLSTIVKPKGDLFSNIFTGC